MNSKIEKLTEKKISASQRKGFELCDSLRIVSMILGIAAVKYDTGKLFTKIAYEYKTFDIAIFELEHSRSTESKRDRENLSTSKDNTKISKHAHTIVCFSFEENSSPNDNEPFEVSA
jgi:hypothetical protein